MSISKTRHYITLALTILLAVAFLGAGFAKVFGQASMVEAFTHFELPDWFRVSIGLLEMLGGILLIIPSFTSMASFGLSIIMIGGAACHAMYDPLNTAAPALLFFVVLTYVYLTRKNVVPKFLQKKLIG